MVKKLNIKESYTEQKYRLVDYFDVWGNEEDGYEVNNSRVVATDIVIPDEYTERDIFHLLKFDVEFFNKNVMPKDVYMEEEGDSIVFYTTSDNMPLCALEPEYN